LGDLDLESKPTRVFVRGEYTKTKTDRVVFLTDEVVQQLNIIFAYVITQIERTVRGARNHVIMMHR
jgi:hypothetical protein